VKFLDTAPLAKTREEITYGSAGPSLKPAAAASNNSAIFAGRTTTRFPPDKSNGKSSD
jgi:hypothetical protein